MIRNKRKKCMIQNIPDYQYHHEIHLHQHYQKFTT